MHTYPTLVLALFVFLMSFTFEAMQTHGYTEEADVTDSIMSFIESFDQTRACLSIQLRTSDNYSIAEPLNILVSSLIIA